MKPCEVQLLADLKATFPGIHARPLREFGAEGWDYGVWTGGEADMPDDMPIFSTMNYGDPEFNGDVHAGFLAWLAQRGWYIETYDHGTYMIVPISDAEEANPFPVWPAAAPLQQGECPF
jgi:hypothetical protein